MYKRLQNYGEKSILQNYLITFKHLMGMWKKVYPQKGNKKNDDRMKRTVIDSIMRDIKL